MPWHAIAVTARDQAVLLLLAYGVPLVLAWLAYGVQISILENRKVFVALLRRRRTFQWIRVIFWGGCFAFVAFGVTLVVGTAYFITPETSGLILVTPAVAVVAFLHFLDGVRFALRPRGGRWRPVEQGELHEPFPLVHGSRRARIGLQIYWYSLARQVALPAFAVALVIGLGKPEKQPVGWFVVWVPALAAYRWFKSAPRWALPAASAMLALGRLEHQMRGRIGQVRAPAADNDPLDWCRDQLWPVSADLHLEARRLDRLMRGPDPHPVASVLRAAARYLRTFLVSENSLASRLPVELQAVIGDLAVVLAGPSRAEAYRRLSHAVGAFDTEGRPTVTRRRHRLAVGPALNRVGESSKALRELVVLPLLVILVIATIATTHLDLAEIARWVPELSGLR